MTASAETPPLLIFSDLDGTLLASDFSPADAASSVRRAVQHGVPVIPCSAKTLAELLPIRVELGLEGFPCIGENGSLVLWPDGTSARLEVFGLPSREIRDRLHCIGQRTGVALTGYSALGPDEVASLTGLGPAAARRAMDRHFSETLVDHHPPDVWERLEPEFRREGLVCWPGGRFHTVTGLQADKGRAVKWVAAKYGQAASRSFTTVGIGDSANDLPMLGVVSRAYLVQRPGGRWESLHLPGLVRVAGVGPVGFSLATELELAALRRDYREK